MGKVVCRGATARQRVIEILQSGGTGRIRGKTSDLHTLGAMQGRA